MPSGRLKEQETVRHPENAGNRRKQGRYGQLTGQQSQPETEGQLTGQESDWTGERIHAKISAVYGCLCERICAQDAHGMRKVR